MRCDSLSVRTSLAAECPEEVSLRVEYLHPVVVAVSNNVLANPVDGHPGQAIELAIQVAVTTKGKGVLKSHGSRGKEYKVTTNHTFDCNTVGRVRRKAFFYLVAGWSGKDFLEWCGPLPPSFII